MIDQMSPDAVTRLFSHDDGAYRFARWGRPIVPVVFGVGDETVGVLKGAIELVVALAGHKMAETDPELGANLMVFFFREWDELPELEHLDEMIPNLPPLVEKLKAQDATQYRLFRFDDAGAIQACFIFVRMSGVMENLPADHIALDQAVRSVLLWGPRAFEGASPLAMATGVPVLRPEIAGVIQAAYDPVLPAVTQESSHGLRLFARMGRGQ